MRVWMWTRTGTRTRTRRPSRNRGQTKVIPMKKSTLRGHITILEGQPSVLLHVQAGFDQIHVVKRYTEQKR